VKRGDLVRGNPQFAWWGIYTNPGERGYLHEQIAELYSRDFGIVLDVQNPYTNGGYHPTVLILTHKGVGWCRMRNLQVISEEG